MISVHAFVLKKWNTKILPHLPKDLDELANKIGVIERKCGINSFADLLKILFLYTCSKISFRILAFVACVLGISNISNTAWRKQFSKSVLFLREILYSMLSSFIFLSRYVHFKRNKECTARGCICNLPGRKTARTITCTF